MIIRSAKMEDLSALAKIGEECYPPEEAITKSEYKKRLNVYPEHFWILEDNGEIKAFINGPVINTLQIDDDLFHNAELHDENGDWQAILGVNTSPKHQKKGYASQIMKQLIADAQKQGRKGCILSCKEGLVDYYQKFGFKKIGVSKSVLAGHVWYDMALFFNP